jgi:alcohol dehydrogenase class IV
LFAITKERMNSFVFHSPTKVLFSEGEAQHAFDVIREYGAKKTLIVTDNVLLQKGIIEPAINSFRDGDCQEPVIFSDVPPDSDVDIVNAASAIAKSERCDSVLAIGGGSVLDTAKVVNVCLSLGGELMDYEGLNNLTSRLLPLVAVPTTAGTGSEVSMVAMVKDVKENKKLLFGSRFLAPDAAILDPTLIVSLPPKLTAATGLDAVTHDIEAYSATISRSNFTDCLCLESIRLLFDFLPRATSHGDDLEARSATLVASTMAGVAFTNSGVGIVHALSHATGGQFGTHHGMTNSVFFPHGMRFNLDAIASRYASIARFLGLSKSKNDKAASEALIEAVEELSKRIGLPTRLRDLGVPELKDNQIEELAFIASVDAAIMFNPKESSIKDLMEIYSRAY